MIWLLLVLYQLKHFICDYPLQNKFMLGKFLEYPKFIIPLTAHCLVHAGATFLIVSLVAPEKAGILALVDFVCHFVMDRIKAAPNLLGRFSALSKEEMKNILSYVPTLGEEGVKHRFGNVLKSNVYFWWSLGLDQMVHHLTHYFIIWCIV